MKKSILAKTFGFTLAAAVVASALILPGQTVSADTADDIADSDECIFSLEDAEEHVEGKLIVSTKGVDLTAVDSVEDATYSIKKLDFSFNENVYAVEYDPSMTAEEIEELFSSIDGIQYVQYSYIYSIDPVDDYVSAGSEYMGWQHDYIYSQNAWNLLYISEYTKVRVGIVDQGVQYTHAELEGQMNVSLCYDAYYEEPLTSYGFGYHGTHVAGIVAANNGGDTDGCRGVASGYDNDIVELVSVNVFPSGSGSTDSEPIARGIQYATDVGCSVINMSLGGNGYDLLQHQAVGYAYDRGVVIVCAAGNSSSQSMHHPGDYSECICVIALDAFADPTYRCKASYSNYGNTKDISAPGTGIYSTSTRNGGYEYLDGTSMACPVVTGVVAMMKAINPGLTATDIKDLLQWSAIDLYTSGFDIYTAYGMVNAGGAVQLAMERIPGLGKTPRQDFIWRLYEIILDRYPDDVGYAHWQEEFDNGATGSDVVRAFCLCQELQNQKLTDAQYISVLYRAIFNRAPDDTGYTQWYNFLSCGGSREALVAHFINSQEFANLCAGYGIPTGPVMFPSTREMNPSTFCFVYRAYKICLRRTPETDGFEFWCQKMNSGELSAGDFIANVFMSQEYLNRRRSNAYYIYDLYDAFFDRDPDDDGYYHWKELLDAGYDRNAVLSDFIHSQEFINLCASYGVRPF